MNKIKELREKLAKQLAEMKAANESIDKGADDAAKTAARAAFEAKRAEVEATQKSLEDAIDDQKRLDASEKALGDADAATIAINKRGSVTAPAQATDHETKAVDHERVFQKYLANGTKFLSGEELSAFGPDKSKGFSEKSEGGVMLPRRLAVKMFGVRWAKQVGMSDADIMRATKASVMVSGTPALGGYTVPEDFRLPVLDLTPEPVHILPRATIIPAPTGEVTMPMAKQTDANEFGGMAGAWVNEAGAKPQTDTQFDQVKITAYEYAMYTQVSIRLLSRSAIAMENWITTKGRQVCLDALDAAFINGDGNGKPTGILQTAGIRLQGRSEAGTVVRDDLVALKYALKPYHRAGGTYILNDSVANALELAKDGEGRPLFAASVANGMYDRLCGYPFITSTRLPALGTQGDAMFVDLREYYVAMEQDVVVKRSDDYDIVHNVATIVMFVVAGGKLVQPRVAAVLDDATAS
jgi:HK97 family phage major capsid protein